MEKLNRRIVAMALAIFLLLSILVVQLGRMTLTVSAEEKVVSGRTTRTITLKGERGSILDRNGQPLAFNQKSYDIEYLRDPSHRTEVGRAMDTQIIYETIQIVEANGGETIDTFNIYRRDPSEPTEAGEEQEEFYFYWGSGLTEEQEAAREKKLAHQYEHGSEPYGRRDLQLHAPPLPDP